MSKAGLAVAFVLVAALAFGGGWVLQDTMADDTAGIMTPEERQAFMQGHFGGERPEGMPAGGMRGGGLGAPMEGTVITVDAESVTVGLEEGGSRTAYYTDDTVVAFAEGCEATEIVEGAQVLVVGELTADGVFTARVVVVE